jgi:2-keto-3-deoxy-L-rhamnonate aldolase RhmA
MINTKEQTEEVVQRAKFPPVGKRGTAYSCRSAQYGVGGGASYLANANEEILVAIHIETPEAVENIEHIMSVPGIDVCYIGPTDLSVTMGYQAEGPGHPEVQRVMDRVLACGQKNGVTVGIQVGNAQGASNKFNWGAKYIGVGITSFLFDAFNTVVQSRNS